MAVIDPDSKLPSGSRPPPVSFGALVTVTSSVVGIVALLLFSPLGAWLVLLTFLMIAAGWYLRYRWRRERSPVAVLLAAASLAVLAVVIQLGATQLLDDDRTIAGMAATPDGRGYWQVGADGAVYAYGTARNYGSVSSGSLNTRIVGIAPHPSGKGYWLAAADGDVFAFGAAMNLRGTGDARAIGPGLDRQLPDSVVAITALPVGEIDDRDRSGYWLLTAHGNVLAYGDARDHGGSANFRRNELFVSMAAHPSGNGYWLAGADGGVFTYGEGLFFHGSLGDHPPARRVVGIVPAPSGYGYWLADEAGRIYPFREARYLGGAESHTALEPIVGVIAQPRGSGYWLYTGKGRVFTFGGAPNLNNSQATLRLELPLVFQAILGVGFLLVGLQRAGTRRPEGRTVPTALNILGRLAAQTERLLTPAAPMDHLRAWLLRSAACWTGAFLLIGLLAGWSATVAAAIGAFVVVLLSLGHAVDARWSKPDAVIVIGLVGVTVILAATAPAPPAVALYNLGLSRPSRNSVLHGSMSSIAPESKGLLGWDRYRHLENLPELVGGAETLQFSSFDRTGGDDDGVTGNSSCLRRSSRGCVIAEETGPGEIESIWLTRSDSPAGGAPIRGDVRRTETIVIELDGRTVLDRPLQEVVDGKLGAPWRFPFVANADQTPAGVYIKVPMPYRNSMTITTRGTGTQDDNPRYYHVTYRRFANADGVSTFNPNDPAGDVATLVASAGTRDPKPALGVGSRLTPQQFSAAPGEQTRLASVTGPGAITELRLRIPQLTGAAITDDGRAFGRRTTAGPRGFSRFTMKVDPANRGIRLTRRLDPQIGRMRARVLIDGRSMARWMPLLASSTGQWAEQTITLPAIPGRSQLTITNEFIASELDFNEFRYEIDSLVGNRWMRTDTLDVGPAHQHDEQAHHYEISEQTYQGWRSFDSANKPSGRRLAASSRILAKARLRISFDGHRTVDTPLGAFFGAGRTPRTVRSLMFSMDSEPGSWYSSWWPMPYGKKATIELDNASDVPIRGGAVQVRTVQGQAWGQALQAKRTGYFWATTNEGPTSPGQDWSFLNVRGRGQIVGVVHTMDGGPDRDGHVRPYVTGDERVHVDQADQSSPLSSDPSPLEPGFEDGPTFPQIHGTGTGDFYEGDSDFRGTAFTLPFNGAPFLESRTRDCRTDCIGAYRLLIADAIPFTESIRFGIEHGNANRAQADYHSITFWYGHCLVAPQAQSDSSGQPDGQSADPCAGKRPS